MVSTTKTITNITIHQILTIKTIKNGFLWCVLGHIPLGFNGFNKPPIESNKLPVENHKEQLQFTLKPIQFPL